MTEADPNIERFLRRNLRTAVRAGLAQPGCVAMIHGSLLGLRRTGDLPDDVELLRWAAEEGLGPDDVGKLHGIALAVRHGERDFGRLSVQAAPGNFTVQLTEDEARAARGALWLVLWGPFCNEPAHRPPDYDPLTHVHTLTGANPEDLGYLMAAIDEQQQAAREARES